MAKKQGFVVVQKTRVPEEQRQNFLYRGVDRLVPWRMENYQRGFDDPYEDEKYGSEGLIQEFSLAQEVLTIFSRIVPREDLEILWVSQESNHKAEPVGENLKTRFLGFDVAGNSSPFYSIVSDFPTTGNPKFQEFRERLNEDGLFDSRQTALNYLEELSRNYPEYRNQGIVIWQVFLAEDLSHSPLG